MCNILGQRCEIVLTRSWLGSTWRTACTLDSRSWMESETTLRTPIQHFSWEFSHTFTTPFTGKDHVIYIRKEDVKIEKVLTVSCICKTLPICLYSNEPYYLFRKELLASIDTFIDLDFEESDQCNVMQNSHIGTIVHDCAPWSKQWKG